MTEETDLSYHFRYSYGLEGNQKYKSLTHAVDNVTLKTLCGVNAENWHVLRDRTEVTCYKCRKTIENKKP